MPNKKIAIIRTDPKPIDFDSYNCQELGLAYGLAKLSVDTDVYMAGDIESGNSIKTFTAHVLPGKIRIITLTYSIHPIFNQMVYNNLESTLCKEGYDLLHVNEINEIATCHVAKIARKYQIKMLVYQGMYKNLSGKLNKIRQLLYKFYCYPKLRNSLNYTVAKTTQAERYLKHNRFLNISIFPVGLDQSKFNKTIDIDFRNQLHIPSNHKILTYVGIFEKRRNPDFLLKIADTLKQERYSMILAGDGDEIEKIRRTVENKNLKNVYLTGKISQAELPSLYKQSDLFLLASDYEIYGMVVLESLYFGCPVFSTSTAGPENMVKSNFNGYLFDGLDESKWVSKIRKITDNFNRNEISTEMKSAYLWDILAVQYVRQYLYFK
jgi:glycosyltransferase involved in cell wall biosynthesis